jgi:hypothetical protein
MYFKLFTGLLCCFPNNITVAEKLEAVVAAG